MTGIRETKIPAVDMSMKESLAFSYSEITQAGKRTALSGILVELDKLGTPEPSSDAILNLTDEEKAEFESDIAEVTSNPANWEQRIANKASAYKKTSSFSICPYIYHITAPH